MPLGDRDLHNSFVPTSSCGCAEGPDGFEALCVGGDVVADPVVPHPAGSVRIVHHQRQRDRSRRYVVNRQGRGHIIAVACVALWDVTLVLVGARGELDSVSPVI